MLSTKGYTHSSLSSWAGGFWAAFTSYFPSSSMLVGAYRAIGRPFRCILTYLSSGIDQLLDTDKPMANSLTHLKVPGPVFTNKLKSIFSTESTNMLKSDNRLSEEFC